MLLRFAALIAVVACLACSTPEERLAEHLENGALFTEREQFDDAILEYRSALKLDPLNAEVNERLGERLAMSQPTDAAIYFRDAFRLDPKRIDAGLKAARMIAIDDLGAATEIVNEVVSHAPKEAGPRIVASELAILRNDSRSALASARRARQLDPTSWSSWYQLGRAHQARIAEGQHRKRPTDRDFDAALEAFTKADELASGSILARLELARVHSSRFAHRNQAQVEFENAMRLAKEKGNLRDRLEVAEAALQFSRQVEDPVYRDWALRAVIENAPEQLLAWSRLAILEDSRGGDGLSILEELIAKRPNDISAQLIYTTYLISNRKAQRALTHLRELLDSGLDAPGFWEQITQIQIQRGNLANARATYVEMLDRHPVDLVTRRADARIAIAEGRYEAASESLRALAAEADSLQIQYLLASSELARGNLANAAAAIERAEPRSGSTPPDVIRLRARIQHATGEFQQVVESFEELRTSGAGTRPIEKLMLAQSLYEIRRRDQGRKLLMGLLSGPRPIPEAATEYARREGGRDRDGAYGYLMAALDQNPVDLGVLQELTRIDTAAGNTQAAIARLDGALKTGRAQAAIVLLRGRTLADSKQYEKAEHDALFALEADPTLEGALELLFSIYLKQGTLAQAQRSFEEAEAAGVLNSGARQLLARIYRHNGEPDRARPILEKLGTTDPELLSAKADLARLLADTDTELDRALELAEEVQQRRSRDANAADVVGYIYLRKGLNEAALQQFRYAIELDQLNREAATFERHYHLGLALRAMKRNREASRAFGNALRLDPDATSAQEIRSQLEAIRSSDELTSSSS